MSRRRKEARSSELLEAAFEEFSQKGFAATRLDDIATRADVTKGTIYVYFSNKEHLFASMVRDLMTPAFDDLEPLMSFEGKNAQEVIKNVLHFIYDTIASERRQRELMRLLILEAERFPELAQEHFEQFLGPLLRNLAEHLNSLADKGEIRRAPVLEFPEIIMGPAISLNIWRLVFLTAPEVDTKLHREAVFDLLLNGLLPRLEEDNGL